MRRARRFCAHPSEGLSWQIFHDSIDLSVLTDTADRLDCECTYYVLDETLAIGYTDLKVW